jgi:hypothetical protein
VMSTSGIAWAQPEKHTPSWMQHGKPCNLLLQFRVSPGSTYTGVSINGVE